LLKRIFNQTMAGYYLYRLLGAISPLIPPRIGYALFGLIGSLFFDLFADAREPLRANLKHVMRGASQWQIDMAARGLLRNHLKNYYDFFRASRLSTGQIKGMVEVHGLEHLVQAHAKGKGVIFITAHFGNLDIVGQTFALYGYQVTTPAEHVRPEVLFQEIAKVRASKGMKIIPVDGPLIGLVRALKRKEIIGLAADLDVTRSGLVVDFFDEPARLPDGYAQLALRTGAPILPAYSLRRADNTFEAHAEPAMELESTGDFKEDVRAGVEQVVRVMERWIGAHPEQWLMFHRIWEDGKS
jgi:lauroyl/myristoyl acyltransferase